MRAAPFPSSAPESAQTDKVEMNQAVGTRTYQETSQMCTAGALVQVCQEDSRRALVDLDVGLRRSCSS